MQPRLSLGHLLDRRAFLEGVPHYLPAYSHRTTKEIIAGKETMIGSTIEQVCRKYQVTPDEIVTVILKRAAIGLHQF